jgi:PAS domain S-box-containing protein
MDKHPLDLLSTPENMSPSATDGHSLHEAIISASDLSIISINREGIITSFNKAAEKLLGYQASEVIGKTSPEIFHDPEEIALRNHEIQQELEIKITPGFESLVTYALEKKREYRREWTYIRKDGTRIPVLLSISQLFDTDNKHIGFVGIASDFSEQKKIRARIEESEAQLQSLVSSLDDIVFEIDEQGRYQKVWVKSDEYLFLPREKIYGRTIGELFGEEFAKPFNAGHRRVLDTGETFVIEYKSLAGDERWFSAKYSLIYKDGQRTNRVSVCIQDITDRKTIELSLRESEEKFRRLAENIPGVVYLMRNDEQNTVIYINEQVIQLTGYSSDEFLEGKVNLVQLVHEDDTLYVDNVRAKSILDKVSFQLEYRIKHQSKGWRWISETGVGVYDGDTPLLLEGFITDITEKKESEEELRRMADENSRMFNNSLSLACIANFNGYFEKLNPAWERVLGWSIEELMARPFVDFVHPDDAKKTSDVSSYVSGGHAVSTFENRYRCKDGSYRWLLWSSFPDVARKITYASAIDITGRKKSEEELINSKRNLEAAAFELEEQNRQLDEFAHIISHNLRAPVNNIKALLNFLNDTSRIEDYQLIFEKIRNVTYNISETMNELMETIKIKKNSEIERVEIRFKDILDKVIQSLEGDLMESGATVTYNFNNAPKIYYSKPYMESILQNLISNAIKYRSPNRIPEIFISSDLIKTGIELRVQDNGLGIDLQRFGNKLFGLHKTFHENSEARGVGLFLTKTQIEALGGSISAESEVDKGTTFIISF